nr:hypothetical protein [Tanacetum cinerariifolium]
MVLVDHTGWKLRRRQWTGTTEQLIEQLESTYDYAPNMFSIRIHHGGTFRRYPGRMYVNGHVDIFDMVDIDLFTVVALNMMSQFSDINLSFVSQQASPSQVIEVMRQLSFEETKLDEKAGFGDVAGSGVESSGLSHDESFGVDDLDLNLNEHVDLNGNGQEDESAHSDGQFFNDDEGIDTAYENQYDVQSIEDACTDDDDDDEDDDFLVDEGNEIVEPDVDVHLFVDNGSTHFTTAKEANDRVYMHFIESRINLKLYKNDNVRIRARCDRKVSVFTMSQGTRPTGPNCEMEVGPSRSSGPSSKSKKKRIQVVRTYRDTRKCLQSRKIKHYTYKFLSEKIFDQVRVNLEFTIKAVQDQLQCELELQISMSKAFRAKAKAERDIRGDHVLQYSILRDYIVELQSTNPNTTVKIVVERNIDQSLPTRMFQRIYVCLGALKLGFRACRRELLGLDGGTTPRSLGKPLLLVDYIEGNILSQGTTNLWDQVLGEVHMSNNTFATNASCLGGNNAKASGSTSRKPQQVEPAVGQDGLGGSGFGVVIGLSVADGAGGESDTSVGVGSQGSSHSRWTKRRVQTERISPQNRTHTQPASQPSTNSQVLVSETRNADGREMGDGIPTQSSVVGGASE